MRPVRLSLLAAVLLFAALVCAVLIPSDTEAAKKKKAPNPPALFGFNENFYGQHSTAAAVMASRDAGANVDRIPVPWKALEPSPGVYNWEILDRVYSMMLYARIKPVVVLFGAPCWAHPSTSCEPGISYGPEPAYFPYYARTAAAIAKRYPHLAALQVGNEPNFKTFWYPKPNAVHYASLLNQSAYAINRANPRMTVLAAAMSPLNFPDAHLRYGNFLKTVFSKPWGAPWVDGLAHHPYPAGNGVTNWVGSVKEQMNIIRGIQKGEGVLSKPIWVTETGVSTSGSTAVSPLGQAQRLRDIHTYLDSLPYVPAIFFHRLYDDPTGSAWEQGTGMLRADGSRKPVICLMVNKLRRGRGC